MAKDKANEIIRLYGKSIAFEVANSIFKEHFEYADPNYIWRGDFQETYTNADKCKYWGNVRDFIGEQD